MAYHSRSKSKGAFSLLSIDTFRSFSRAGSRQARPTDIDLTRSPSSLSCNPHDQQPAEPQSPTAATELTGLTLTGEPEPKRRRPLSWLSLRGARRLYPRSMSMQLPKDTSCSTMGRSAISAPILTSTTNSKVAAAEGVQCRDTFGEQDSRETTETAARRLAEDIMVEQPTPHHRPSRRFVDVLKAKIRRRERTFIKIEEEESIGINRRRAETINLCKDKIKNLTGNGYINRKSITESNNNKHAGIEHLLSHKESRAALLRKTSQAALDFESEHQPDNVSPFGSLSRSFNSALEKLDFQTNNVSFLRSRSSMFNMRKPEEKQESPPSVTPFVPPNTPRPAFTKLATYTTADNATNAGNNDTGTGTTTDTTTNTGTTTDSGTTQQDPDPAVNKGVADDKGTMDGKATQLNYTSGGYTLAAPDPNYPGGINPLRMHTDVTAMAGPKTDQGGAIEKAGNHSRWLDGSAHDSDLEAAPIYSPSMGELSQYARTPPAAKNDIPELTPTKSEANKTGKRSSGKLTKAKDNQDENKSPEPKMKKSKSLVSLVDIFKKEETPPMPTRSSSPFMPLTPSPLRIVHTAKGEEKKRYGMVGMPSPKG